jgi:hypothetical protein
MPIIAQKIQPLPRREAILRADELAANCPEGASYLAERYGQIINARKKHPPECDELLQILDDRAFKAHYLHFPNPQCYFGKLTELSINDFERLQQNIRRNEPKRLLEKGLPQDLHGRYELSESGHVSPSYSASTPIAEDEQLSFNSLFNNYLATKGLVTDENSQINKATENGLIDRALEPDELTELNREIPKEYENFLAESGIDMTVETTPITPSREGA